MIKLLKREVVVSEGFFEKKKLDKVRQIQSYIKECIGCKVKDSEEKKISK